jgi:MoxR-like ATPase
MTQDVAERSLEDTSAMKQHLDQLVMQIGRIILGKERQIRLALACLLAKGHLLIEDVPGVGKTMLAHALARSLGLEFRRIQFTSDLLPADILGTSIYERSSQSFVFHPGPIFGQMILADEVNRATPKTQSALLEAMEERQISADGTTYRLPAPFFVIATQNPRHQIGTFPLPESQLDRFLMCIELGYPDRQAERAILSGQDRRDMLAEMPTVLCLSALTAIQSRLSDMHVSEALLDYMQDILAASRRNARTGHGLSPRAGLALLHAAQAWALMEGRDMVLPEDIQAVASSVVGHRLRASSEGPEQSGSTQAEQLIKSVSLP